MISGAALHILANYTYWTTTFLDTNPGAITSAKLSMETFTFAYLKELFVASMAQWMSTAGKTSMDEVILAQAKSLRGQMSTTQKEKEKKKKKKR